MVFYHKYPNGLWKITNIGDRVIKIESNQLHPQMKSSEELVQLVSYDDIKYPAEQNSYYQQQYSTSPAGYFDDRLPIPSSQTPSVQINVVGTDNSVNKNPPITANEQTPQNQITGSIQSNTEQPSKKLEDINPKTEKVIIHKLG
jgi:hypothetical protein